MDYAQARAYCDEVERTRRQLGLRTGRLADVVKGALYQHLGPRLAMDAEMPDLDHLTEGLDRRNFRSRRRQVADAVRRSMRGKLGRDADLDDIDELLRCLERDEGEEADDRRRFGRDDEPERPGFEPATDPAEEPFAEDFLDSELEELRGQMRPEAYDRLRRARAEDRRHREAEDRRHGRDRTPFHHFDARRRRAEDDPPDFAGMPRTGGSMVPNPSSVDRPGMGEPRDIAARDRARPRRFRAYDAAPASFDRRFPFTGNVTTEDQSRQPAIKSTT